MSGDIQNQYETMKKLLKKIDYKDSFSFEYVKDNNPTFFLRLLHYILVEYNSNFYKTLVDSGYELYSKNDLRFTEQVFKLLQLEFNYKLQINIAQFLSEQYLEHKIIFLNDVINEVQGRTKKEKRQANKGQENIPYQQNTQKCNNEIQTKYKPQPITVLNQKDCLLNEEEDDILEEQPQRPEPYKKCEITLPIEILPKQAQKVSEKDPQQQKELIQRNIHPENEQQSNLEKNQSLQQYEREAPQSPICQIATSLNQNVKTNSYQIQSNQQFQQLNTQPIQGNSVTHQDLQKLMQVILISNENIKSIMQKFSDLQTTVNIALTNFDQRLTRLELKMHDQ